MNRFKSDYSSRFRILKGGKVSLVVSALLVSSSVMVSDANAFTIEIGGPGDHYDFISGNSDSLLITPDGSLIYSGNIALNITTNNLASGQSVVNQGEITLTGGSNASAVFGDTAILGTITNERSISNTVTTNSGAAAVNLMGAITGGTITNASGADITVSSTGGTNAFALGINFGVVSASSTITNAGDINVTSTGTATGINVGAISGDSSVTNTSTGSIIINGYGSGIETDSIADGTISEFVTVENAGSITINDTVSTDSSNGISIDGNLGAYATITNSGTIAITNGHTIYGIAAGDVEGTIENTGDIEIGTARLGAIAIATEKIVNGGQIINSGTITIEDGNLFAMGIAQFDGAVNLTKDFAIKNSGTITVNTTNATPTYIAGIFTYGDNNYAINIENSGTITATINDALDAGAFSILALPSTVASNVTNTLAGKLYGNLKVSGSVTNAGLISLPHNATGKYSALIGGDLVNSGTIEIGMLTDGETTTHSHLRVVGTTTFDTGSILKVNVLEASTDAGLLVGGKLENVLDSGTIEIVSLTMDDNSALLDFEYELLEGGGTSSTDQLNLNIIQAQTVEEAVTSYTDDTVAGGGATPAKAAARALDTIQASIGSHPAMVAVFAELNTLPTNAAVAAAVESTTPQTNGATVGATTQIANGIQGIVEQRQSVNLGMSSGDGMFSDKNFWMKPFGSIAEQNSKDGINGFDVKAGGIGFGIDGDYKDDMRAGFAFFYTQASVDVKDINQNADLDVFTTLAYGSSPIIDNKTKLLYQAGYSWQKTQTDRAVFTGDSATADYTTTTASLDLKVLRDVRINDSLTLQPLAQVTYRHFDSPDYAESGAGALNLHVDGFTSNQLIVGAGVIGHYKLDESSKLIANLNAGYDTRDEAQSVTSSYEGAIGVEFDTVGIDNGRWNYEAGVGYEKDISKTTNINFSYNYQATGSDFANHTVSAKYVLKF